MHLKNAENERNALPQGRMQQLFNQVVFTKKYIHMEKVVSIYLGTHIYLKLTENKGNY